MLLRDLAPFDPDDWIIVWNGGEGLSSVGRQKALRDGDDDPDWEEPRRHRGGRHGENDKPSDPDFEGRVELVLPKRAGSIRSFIRGQIEGPQSVRGLSARAGSRTTVVSLVAPRFRSRVRRTDAVTE